MFRKLLVPLLLGSSIIGCAQQGAPGAPTNAAASRQGATAPIEFEVREFSVDKRSESYGGSSYSGRGSLISRDPSLQSGNFIVFVRYKSEHRANEEAVTQVLLSDGLGTLYLSAYLSDEDESQKTVRFFDWEIIGFIKLESGVIRESGAQSP